MKTLTKTTVLIATALLISLNVMASGFQFDQETYIDDIPFNLDSVEIQVRFEEAVSVIFSLNEENFINDMTFTDNDLDEISNYYKATVETFDFEEEEYIDDIPFLSTSNSTQSKDSYYAEIR